MNKFAVFVFVAFVGDALATPTLDADDLACIAETKVSEASVRHYNENYEFDHDDHAFKCFIKCSMLQDNLVNESGDYDPAKLVDFIVKEKDPEDTTTVEQKMALFSLCDNSEVSGDACERSAAAAHCIVELIKAINKLASEASSEETTA